MESSGERSEARPLMYKYCGGNEYIRHFVRALRGASQVRVLIKSPRRPMNLLTRQLVLTAISDGLLYFVAY